MARIILPREIDVLVASYGGVGTTALIKFLSRYFVTNKSDDGDGFKHLPVPPISFNRNLRFIYIYGDPRVVTLSLFRRGFQRPQSVKLQRWNNQKRQPIEFGQSLPEYLKGGRDLLCLEDQFDKWYSKYLPPQPVLFIKHEQLYECAGDVINFLGLPGNLQAKFPQRKRRESVLANLDTSTRFGLDAIYGGFAAKLARLPDWEVRYDSSTARYLAKCVRSVEYKKALKDDSGARIKAGVRRSVPTCYHIIKRYMQSK